MFDEGDKKKDARKEKREAFNRKKKIRQSEEEGGFSCPRMVCVAQLREEGKIDYDDRGRRSPTVGMEGKKPPPGSSETFHLQTKKGTRHLKGTKKRDAIRREKKKTPIALHHRKKRASSSCATSDDDKGGKRGADAKKKKGASSANAQTWEREKVNQALNKSSRANATRFISISRGEKE